MATQAWRYPHASLAAAHGKESPGRSQGEFPSSGYAAGGEARDRAFINGRLGWPFPGASAIKACRSATQPPTLTTTKRPIVRYGRLHLAAFNSLANVGIAAQVLALIERRLTLSELGATFSIPVISFSALGATFPVLVIALSVFRAAFSVPVITAAIGLSRG
jgi:hypothetical protein